jgi:CHAT domain-containing protein/Tfp pilus assembly protein PilF
LADPPAKAPGPDEELARLERRAAEAQALEGVGLTAATWEQALDAVRVFGPSAPLGVAQLTAAAGRAAAFHRADTARREVRDRRAAALGADDWRTADARRDLDHLGRLGRRPAVDLAALAQAADLGREALRLYMAGKPLDALAPAREADVLGRRVFGDSHLATVPRRNVVAALSREVGDYKGARRLYQEALDVRRAAQGPDHPDVAVALNNLALVNRDLGDYPTALAQFDRARAIQKSTIGPTQRPYAITLSNLGLLHQDRGEYDRALTLFREAQDIIRAADGERSPAFAVCLNNLANLHADRGAYETALPLLEQARDVVKASHGEGTAAYATALNNLALLHQDRGAFEKALPLLDRALAIRRAALTEEHPSYATSLISLANLYRDTGAHERALPLYEQAMEIQRTTLGEGHPAYAVNLNNQALLHRAIGVHHKALPLFERAVAVQEKAVGPAHPAYAVALTNLGVLHRDLGALDKAEPLLDKAVQVQRQAVTENHPGYAAALLDLALLDQARGDHKAALTRLDRVCEIRRVTLGEDHPEHAAGLRHLALLHHARGTDDRAAPLARRALGTAAAFLDRSAVAQAESAQLAHAAALRGHLDAYLAVTQAPGSDPAEVYAAVLTVKGAVTARQRLARAARAAAADPRAAELLKRLDQAASDLARLARNPGPEADTAARLASLAADHERAEQALAAQADEFRRARAERALTPAGLRELLPEKGALVDYVAYQNQGEARLVAFVVTRTAVVRTELGPLAPITKAADRFVTDMARRTPVRGADDPAVALRDRAWGPVEKHLKGVGTVLVSPDGPLCRVPFAALPTADGKRYLIEDLAIAALPVPRLLPDLIAKRRKPGDPPPSLLAVGDIEFGQPMVVAANDAGQSNPWDGRGGNRVFWKRLDGARKELQNLVGDFQEAVPNGRLTQLTKLRATEVAFRQEAPTHAYIHLATHGYFAPAEPASPGRASPARHPGLQSGVVFAGANNPPGDGPDDGVLTALETGGLDLSRVELVVLSACDTGLGEAAAGEGLLGLQRAFQVAGARTTVASYWEVYDGATQTLMTRFYTNYWINKMGTLAALRQAQLSMLAEGPARGMVREKDVEPDPSSVRLPPIYWAAFVLSGNWR